MGWNRAWLPNFHVNKLAHLPELGRRRGRVCQHRCSCPKSRHRPNNFGSQNSTGVALPNPRVAAQILRQRSPDSARGLTKPRGTFGPKDPRGPSMVEPSPMFVEPSPDSDSGQASVEASPQVDPDIGRIEPECGRDPVPSPALRPLSLWSTRKRPRRLPSLERGAVLGWRSRSMFVVAHPGVVWGRFGLSLMSAEG